MSDKKPMSKEEILAYFHNPDIINQLGGENENSLFGQAKNTYKDALSYVDQYSKDYSKQRADELNKLLPSNSGQSFNPDTVYNTLETAQGLGNISGITKAQKLYGPKTGKLLNSAVEEYTQNANYSPNDIQLEATKKLWNNIRPDEKSELLDITRNNLQKTESPLKDLGNTLDNNIELSNLGFTDKNNNINFQKLKSFLKGNK